MNDPSIPRMGRSRAWGRPTPEQVRRALARVDVHQNAHQGKVGVLCLAPEEGLGVRHEEMRAQHIDAINRFRGV